MSAEARPKIHHEEVPHTDGRRELRVFYVSNDVATREALVGVARELRGFGLCECELQTVQQVLAEILNNVVEHACADDTSALIELRVILEESIIHAQVIDSGRPMPGGTLPEPAPPHPTDLPEGGFGWCIIRAMADRISYVREGGRNRLSVSLRRDRKP
ncbi:serine/threonine-protein kinase RsbW [Palleronia marisminoris]|uniref:Histidine kinase/HSP90-like ATPase domain-containing protein n=1 Tax=Palleronia marisminoris TaxID=315423 RepID=A0A1Y5SKC6_9RHOB|nr:ATP-binding protein [Palleronia marisminoris]SFG86530.1 serine/threonine-protein kinase RsbW [Palleronia marisminoris]SLN42795.1 hypothetical protein PAM7066_01856 [Palleronia marisminoris]